MTDPVVSIIMATYNRAHLIGETLNSILKQSYSNWECLIIDDGSDDKTSEVIRNYLEKDQRLRYFERPVNYQKGLSGCRNFGLDLCAGEYIIFFDDDDIVHPRNLEICQKELRNTIYSFCRYKRETFTGKFHYNFDQEGFYNRDLLNGTETVEDLLTNKLPFNSCAIMWRNECFANQRFKENLQYAEEWELYSRILSEGFNGISISKTLFYGRKHPESNTGEYGRRDPVRVASQKEAIRLVVKNLKTKKLLTITLLEYLLSLAITYRDRILMLDIMATANTSKSMINIYKIKYTLYPAWSMFNQFIKRLNR